MSLLSLGRDTVRRLDCLRPDVEGEDESVLTGLNQFDFLAYLSYRGRLRRRRHWRLLRQLRPLLRDPHTARRADARHHLPADDQRLAAALREIDHRAQQEGFRYDGWEGATHPT